MTSARIVVIHGPVAPELAHTLTRAGLSVVAAGADTTIYGSPAEPAAQSSAGGAVPVEAALFPVPEAAAQLGVGRSSVYRLIDRGELETVHVGRSVRVPAGAVTDLMDRRRRRPGVSHPQRPKSDCVTDRQVEASILVALLMPAARGCWLIFCQAPDLRSAFQQLHPEACCGCIP